MNVSFENLQIKKIITHEVFKPENKTVKQPNVSDYLTILPDEGLKNLQKRITQVMGKESKSIKMDIALKSDDSCYYYSSECYNVDEDEKFITVSKKIAERYSTAHTSAKWPGGLIVVISATITAINIPCIFIIKADEQSGFSKKKAESSVILTFLQDVFLTPSSKLYKIGVFIKDKEYAYLFDSNIKSFKTESAATYFYSNFLGLSFPSDSKQNTRKFYELTTEFIEQTNLPGSKKIELQQALHIELKVSKKTVIEPLQFAEDFFPEELNQDYINYLKNKDFPIISISKDITLIKDKLKIRRLNFSTNVKITAPSESFNDLIKIVSEDDEGYTTIKVKGNLSNQN